MPQNYIILHSRVDQFQMWMEEVISHQSFCQIIVVSTYPEVIKEHTFKSLPLVMVTKNQKKTVDMVTRPILLIDLFDFSEWWEEIIDLYSPEMSEERPLLLVLDEIFWGCGYYCDSLSGYRWQRMKDLWSMSDISPHIFFFAFSSILTSSFIAHHLYPHLTTSPVHIFERNLNEVPLFPLQNCYKEEWMKLVLFRRHFWLMRKKLTNSKIIIWASSHRISIKMREWLSDVGIPYGMIRPDLIDILPFKYLQVFMVTRLEELLLFCFLNKKEVWNQFSLFCFSELPLTVEWDHLLSQLGSWKKYVLVSSYKKSRWEELKDYMWFGLYAFYLKWRYWFYL